MIITKMLMTASNNYGEKKGFIDYNRILSYKELGYRAEKVKKSLQRLAVKHGDRVALLLTNSSPYLEISFGATAMGAIVIPLNIRLNIKELAFILNDCEAEILFVESEFLSVVPELKEMTNSLQKIIAIETEVSQLNHSLDDIYDYEKLLTAEPTESLKIENVKEEDIAGIFYTSGTTGRPKGVVHTHRSLFFNSANHVMFARIKHNDVFLHSLPMFHIGGFLGFLSRTLVGVTHVALRSFDTKKVLQLCEKEKITALVLAPTMANMLLNDPDFDKYNLSSLETFSYGASPMPIEVLRLINRKLPNVQFTQGYGSTETVAPIMILTKEHHDRSLKGNEKEKKRLSSAGQPIGGVEVKLIRPDQQEALVGEIGEIVARGPMLMKGYWNLPEETNQALQDGWYRTGDVGYRDEDNFYYIVDRAKDMIISGGENIYSIEVEDVLYQHPKILECAVIGVPDEKWGEAVKAILVAKPGQKTSEEEILKFVRSHLANYKVPKSVEFCDELPKNGAGKIQKHALRKKYWEGKTRMVN